MEAVAALLAPCESSMGWVVAPTYELGTRVYTRVEIALRTKFEHRVVYANPREHRIVVRNLGGGLSEMRGKSADNPVSLLGEGLDWVIVDEAARLKRDVWESYLSQRLVDREGWALFLSTPRGVDWFYQLYKRGRRGVEGFASWSSPSWANPLLDRAVIEAERERLSEEAFEQEYGAVFLGEEAEPCSECGRPDPNVSGTVVVQGPYAFPLCATCGKETDGLGHTIWTRWPDGSPQLTVIELVFRAPEYVSEGRPPVQCEAAPEDLASNGTWMRTGDEFFGPRA
jgi:hypothetical protein